MRPFPPSLDFGPWEKRLDNVVFTQFATFLHFDGGAAVRIEGEMEITRGAKTNIVPAGKICDSLDGIVGRTPSVSVCENHTTLVLDFQNLRIRCVPCDQYEVVSLSCAGKEIFS